MVCNCAHEQIRTRVRVTRLEVRPANRQPNGFASPVILFFYLLRKVKLYVLAIHQNFSFVVANAGIRDSKFTLERERNHALGWFAWFAACDVFSGHVDFHLSSSD